jgi:hypothetical protein
VGAFYSKKNEKKKKKRGGVFLSMESPTKKSSPSAKKTELNVYAAELFLALEDRGITQRDFVQATKNTSHKMSEATLSRNIKALKKGESPYKDSDKRGRPAKLTDEQWNIVAGAILCFDKKNGFTVGCELDRP